MHLHEWFWLLLFSIGCRVFAKHELYMHLHGWFWLLLYSIGCRVFAKHELYKHLASDIRAV
jgi:uncharacterized protein involved in type VI secretion and phage assembly